MVYIKLLKKTMKFIRKIIGTNSNALSTSSSEPPKELLSQTITLQQEKVPFENFQKSLSFCQTAKNAGQTEKTFNFGHEASLLRLKILKIGETVEADPKCEIEWGFIIGMVNQNQSHLDLIPEECFTVRVGPQEEINSITAIRKRSLDSLIIFFNKDHQDYLLADILQSGQKLVFIFDHWNDVKSCIHGIEKVLLQNCGERSVEQYSHLLLSTLTFRDSRYFLSFSSEKQFQNYFAAQLIKRSQTITRSQQLESLMKMMTLEQYRQLKNGQEIKTSLKRKIQLNKKQIEKQVHEKKKKEQLKRVDLLFAEEETKKEINHFQSANNLGHTTAIGTDFEVEYFGKRESQIETRESNCSRRVCNEDLYYFIEEHQSSGSGQDVNQFTARYSNNQPLKTPNLVRTKSWNSLSQAAQQDLDDEFFNKY